MDLSLTGYHAGDADEDKSKITFQVAITMLEHDFNETGYTIGFTIWEKDMSRVEIMWASQQEVEALNDTLPELVINPDENRLQRPCLIRLIL